MKVRALSRVKSVLKPFVSHENVRGKDTSKFAEQRGQIRQSNLQNFLDHRVAPRGAVHVRFMIAEKKISIRKAPYFSTRRLPTGGDTEGSGIIRIKFLGDFRSNVR